MIVLDEMIFESQNSWMVANVQNPDVSTLKLTSVYIAIGIFTVFFLLFRSLALVALGVQTSRSLFSQLLNSLFRAPMSFFDSTPLGRVLSRVRILKQIVHLPEIYWVVRLVVNLHLLHISCSVNVSTSNQSESLNLLDR